MMDFKVKVTFADGSRRVLKDPSELTKANKRREIRVVFQNGKYIDLHLGRVCPKLGIVKVNTFGLLPEGIKLEKIMGWCYKFPRKTSKLKKKTMIYANFQEGGHSWEKTNLVTREGREMYDTYQCRKCGLKAKMVSFGELQISERFRKKFERCVCVKAARRIEIINCEAVGPQFANLTPGSRHDIINPPAGYDNKGGVWVMGVGEPVKVLFREFSYINQDEQ